AAALRAVEPGQAVRRFVQRDAERLRVGKWTLSPAAYRRVWVVGAGKAGAPMAAALGEILGDRLDGGVVVVKDGHAGEAQAAGQVQVVEAGHPLPDLRGVAAARRVIDLLEGAGEGDLVFCLLSGGGSALLPAPAGEVSLEDLQALTS